MGRKTVMYVGYPAPYAYAAPDGKKKVQQLLWGDWLLVTDERKDGYRFVEKARNESGWMREDDLIPSRLLEVNFVDVGQGDGCFIVTPDDTWILIDAGAGPEMFWYLRWRFNLRNRAEDRDPLTIDHAVLTHPDEDHFAGLGPILESPHLAIGTLHHNGIVQRPGSSLGPEVKVGGVRYLTELAATPTALGKILSKDENVGKALYPNLLRTARASGRVGPIRMLSTADAHLPGFSEDDLTIDVLGPVLEKANGKKALRVLGNAGVTKNGHSVVLRLRYGDIVLGLGGDLNVPAQHRLLEHHAGIDVPGLPPDGDELDQAVADARAVFRVDVAKACHHGSSDIEDLFLRAEHAIATVISSGDGEPHAHPRPDALGAIGRFGRGQRPLIFSTELARSPRASTEHPEQIRREEAAALEAARAEVNAGSDRPEDDGAVAARYQRAIAVYGLITLRTDGEKVLVSQKLERRRGATSFDHYCLEPGPDGLVWNPKR